MKEFKDFGIDIAESSVLSGEKIKIKKVLNERISVKKYKIVPSKFPEKGNGNCLYLQIMFEGKERVIFTGSTILMSSIERVSKDDFPFSTTIIEENEMYKFT